MINSNRNALARPTGTVVLTILPSAHSSLINGRSFVTAIEKMISTVVRACCADSKRHRRTAEVQELGHRTPEAPIQPGGRRSATRAGTATCGALLLPGALAWVASRLVGDARCTVSGRTSTWGCRALGRGLARRPAGRLSGGLAAAGRFRLAARPVGLAAAVHPQVEAHQHQCADQQHQTQQRHSDERRHQRQDQHRHHGDPDEPIDPAQNPRRTVAVPITCHQDSRFHSSPLAGEVYRSPSDISPDAIDCSPPQ